MIFAEGEVVEAGDLLELMEAESNVRLGGKFTLEEIENEHVRRIVATTRTLDEAAAVLGIDPATLYRKRKRW